MMRTSASHPLLIAELPVGAHGGGIGVTFAPGKYQEVAMTGAWARDLDVDVSAIQDWGATHLVTLLEPWELKDLRIESLPAIVAGKGISWHGLPITDGAAPDDRLLKDWLQLSAELVADMLSGQRIVVHCKGGWDARERSLPCFCCSLARPSGHRMPSTWCGMPGQAQSKRLLKRSS